MNSVPTEDDVKQVLKTARGGRLKELYGPNVIGDQQVWECWVLSEDEFQTRFVAFDVASKEARYFSEFQSLAVVLNDRMESSRDQRSDNEFARKQAQIKLAVACVVLVAASAALIYLVLGGIRPDALAFAAFGSLLASSGALIFGNWRKL